MGIDADRGSWRYRTLPGVVEGRQNQGVPVSAAELRAEGIGGGKKGTMRGSACTYWRLGSRVGPPIELIPHETVSKDESQQSNVILASKTTKAGISNT